MKVTILILAIIIGLILGRTKIGYVISTILFIVYWKIIIADGYEMVHMSTIYVGQESGFNGPVADWFAIISSSLLFAFVASIIPMFLGWLFKKLDRFPILNKITDWVWGFIEDKWNKPENKDEAIKYINKLDKEGKQEKIEFIAENSLVPEVACEAVKKIKNKSVLYNIAKTYYKNIDVRKCCVNNIDDKNMLEKLLKNLTRKEDQLKEYIKDKLKEYE